MSGSLSGKTVMLLGGSGPYGAATARALGREGANVALGGRDRQRLEELEEQVRALGGEALVVGVHLAKRHHPAHLVEAAVETFGGLDALLFMACASAPPLESLDIDAFERSLDVNVRGFIYCLAAALPAMRDRGEGHVVVAGPEDTGGAPDPLLNAWRAAVRAFLQELPRGLSLGEIRTAEVRLDSRLAEDPEESARTIVRALKDPAGQGDEPCIHRF
ncbi:MAG: SDR family NAD(P)-dependent oxidoreductase [Actinomycetota bacterium]|nr:SDR family NAD(P)-dependent oxidoreductase [Actinomycetota bacterium]